MPLPNDIAFCCFALDGPHITTAQPLTALPGLTVNSSPAPVELDATWETWLGTLDADAFRKSTFVIMAEQNRGSNDDAKLLEYLERRVRLFHYALVLQGCAYTDGTLMVQGNTFDGHLHVGPISRAWTPCFHPMYRRRKRITATHVRRAGMLLAALELIYDNVPGPDYRRLRKGFNAWIRGAQMDDVGERLHSFVRATEAIIRATTTQGYRRITATFRSRGQTFIGTSKRSDRLLSQLYHLRSCIEHVKDIMPAVHKPKGIHRFEAVAFRALQAEILASGIYERIFSNPDLREQLRTEVRVEGFWRRKLENRKRLWGRSIDINKRARNEFRSTVTLDLI